GKPLPFVWLEALWAVNGVLGVGNGFLAMRSGIRLDGEGLTARSRIRTRRLRWQEIERFELGRSISLSLFAICPHARRSGSRDTHASTRTMRCPPSSSSITSYTAPDSPMTRQNWAADLDRPLEAG